MPVIGKLAVTSAWLNFQCSLVSPHSSPRRGEWHGLHYLTVADIQVHHQELSMVVAPCGNDYDDDDGDNDDDDFHVNDNDDGHDKNNLLFVFYFGIDVSTRWRTFLAPMDNQTDYQYIE